jgi:hypothetical protein
MKAGVLMNEFTTDIGLHLYRTTNLLKPWDGSAVSILVPSCTGSLCYFAQPYDTSVRLHSNLKLNLPSLCGPCPLT